MASDSDDDLNLHLCCVCNETGGDDSSHSIAKCSKCNIYVHRDCYGYPLIKLSSDVNWICDSCNHANEKPNCVLCCKGSNYGPLKRTTDWRWAHLSCGLWIPEVFFRFGEGREPVDYFQIKASRFQQTCCYCHETCGACANCTEPNCPLSFHITCGMANKVFLEYKSNDKDMDIVVTLCAGHGKKWHGKMRGRGSIRAIE